MNDKNNSKFMKCFEVYCALIMVNIIVLSLFLLFFNDRLNHGVNNDNKNTNENQVDLVSNDSARDLEKEFNQAVRKLGDNNNTVSLGSYDYKPGTSSWFIPVSIPNSVSENEIVEFKIDTGAVKTCMSFRTFNKLYGITLDELVEVANRNSYAVESYSGVSGTIQSRLNVVIPTINIADKAEINSLCVGVELPEYDDVNKCYMSTLASECGTSDLLGMDILAHSVIIIDGTKIYIDNLDNNSINHDNKRNIEVGRDVYGDKIRYLTLDNLNIIVQDIRDNGGAPKLESIDKHNKEDSKGKEKQVVVEKTTVVVNNPTQTQQPPTEYVVNNYYYNNKEEEEEEEEEEDEEEDEEEETTDDEDEEETTDNESTDEETTDEETTDVETADEETTEDESTDEESTDDESTDEETTEDEDWVDIGMGNDDSYIYDDEEGERDEEDW